MTITTCEVCIQLLHAPISGVVVQGSMSGRGGCCCWLPFETMNVSAFGIISTDFLCQIVSFVTKMKF
jgi:hypothetical protein